MSEVEGGLDEPTELEPAQGTLALAAPEDRHELSDWEAASAAVLRKTGRMSAEDPDALVWEKLTRTTLDGVAVAPLGTAGHARASTRQPAGRPTRAGDWDVRAHLADPDAERARRAALADLESGVTSLWLELGSGRHRRATCPRCSRRCYSTSRRSCSTRPATRWPPPRRSGAARERGVTPAPGTNLGGDPIGARLVRGVDRAGSRPAT